MTSNEENDVAREARSVACADAPGRWQPIDTAKRNTDLIELCWMGRNGPEDCYIMRWSPTMRNGLIPDQQGFWVTECGGMTWCPGEDGPTHWRPAARSESEDTQPKATHTQEDVDALVKAARTLLTATVLDAGFDSDNPGGPIADPLPGHTRLSFGLVKQVHAALTPFEKG